MSKNKKRVHLIGICGAGMSALAVLFREAGFAVSGSDEKAFEPITGYLRKNRIPWTEGHSPNNIPRNVDLFVIGKHAGLAAKDNTETQAAERSGAPILSLPEALAMFSRGKENILAVGSFGKSTMAGLLAFCLSRAQRDPSYFIGALPVDFNSSHLGLGPEFVLEGDEYPSSNTDPRAKFLHFDPNSVILVSAEHDHVNIYPTEKSYLKPYKELIAKIPKKGTLVYALDAKNTAKIARHCRGRKISYACENKNADWYAANIKFGKISSFDLMRRNKKIARIKTKLLGRHNIENVVGAGALLLENKKMPPRAFAEAIKKFRGIRRRIELTNPRGAIPVYEGFGSSYEKTRAVFETLRLHFPDKRIIAVFEPHAFSWRNKKFLHWYKKIFQDVDEVIMLPATSRGAKAQGEIGTKEIWREAKKYYPIHTARSEKEALQILKKIVKKPARAGGDDVIVLVSSGPMYGLPRSVPKLFT